MPLIKSAIKKMRQDKVRTQLNQGRRVVLKKTLKEAKVETNNETLAKAYSALDRAAKHGLIHKNKAARQKAALAKMLAQPKAETKVAVKKTTKAKKKLAK